MLSALTGKTSETAPTDMLLKTYLMVMLKKFETSLVDELGYKIPKLIGNILIKIKRIIRCWDQF